MGITTQTLVRRIPGLLHSVTLATSIFFLPSIPRWCGSAVAYIYMDTHTHTHTHTHTPGESTETHTRYDFLLGAESLFWACKQKYNYIPGHETAKYTELPKERLYFLWSKADTKYGVVEKHIGFRASIIGVQILVVVLSMWPELVTQLLWTPVTSSIDNPIKPYGVVWKWKC